MLCHVVEKPSLDGGRDPDKSLQALLNFSRGVDVDLVEFRLNLPIFTNLYNLNSGTRPSGKAPSRGFLLVVCAAACYEVNHVLGCNAALLILSSIKGLV